MRWMNEDKIYSRNLEASSHLLQAEIEALRNRKSARSDVTNGVKCDEGTTEKLER